MLDLNTDRYGSGPLTGAVLERYIKLALSKAKGLM